MSHKDLKASCVILVVLRRAKHTKSIQQLYTGKPIVEAFLQRKLNMYFFLMLLAKASFFSGVTMMPSSHRELLNSASSLVRLGPGLSLSVPIQARIALTCG